MLPPDLQFMVHSSEFIDEEGYAHRGSKITSVSAGQEPPPEWRLRDFGFACYSQANAPGLREVMFGKRSVWAFASPREHCEEIVVFRRGTDTRRKWDQDAFHEPAVGLDAFFIMRMRQISEETPLNKQFNGEWGFWESFFVPLLDEQQTMKTLSLMDPATCEDFFVPLRLPVTCYKCPPGREVLTIPDNLTVRYEVKVVCKDLDTWNDVLEKIGDDMVLQEPCVVEHKHLKPGDECIDAYHEMTGIEDHCRMTRRDFEQMKLPAVLTFNCTLNVATEWRPDMISLQYKFDALATVYTTNLLGGYSSLSGARADPWNPSARLAVNALNKIMARYPDIRSILDCGCGDMAWMQYFLKDHPLLAYIGADVMPYCLAVNFRRFPKMHFVQTDLSNLSGIEVLPQGCDLVIVKDTLNHMVLPDAVDSLKRIVSLKPRFLLTHIHDDADNTGWERRIDKHLHYTKYNYNRPPFSLPFPVTEIQKISDDSHFALYEITPESQVKPPTRIERMQTPVVGNTDSYTLVEDGEMVAPVLRTMAPHPMEEEKENEPPAADELGPVPVPERVALVTPVTELPDRADDSKPGAPERKPIKGIPAVEFRARCDLIFEKFDQDHDDYLNFGELCGLMETGGRKIEEYDAYASLCKRLDCDPRIGLTRKDVYKLFEKAPQSVWEEVYRSINPQAQMVKKGAEKLPETFLERPLPNFLFEDDEQFAKVQIEINAHLYYGAAESITEDHIQAFFGKQRLEVHICAPGSYGAQDLYLWKLIVTPLTAEIVPEDCSVVLKETTGRFGSKKLTVKLMKSKKKKWHKVGQASTGQRT